MTPENEPTSAAADWTPAPRRFARASQRMGAGGGAASRGIRSSLAGSPPGDPFKNALARLQGRSIENVFYTIIGVIQLFSIYRLYGIGFAAPA